MIPSPSSFPPPSKMFLLPVWGHILSGWNQLTSVCIHMAQDWHGTPKRVNFARIFERILRMHRVVSGSENWKGVSTSSESYQPERDSHPRMETARVKVYLMWFLMLWFYALIHLKVGFVTSTFTILYSFFLCYIHIHDCVSEYITMAYILLIYTFSILFFFVSNNAIDESK